MPEHYLHGPRGDRTIPTPHRFVTLLARTGVLDQLRPHVKGLDAELDAVLVAYMLAAQESGGADPRTVSAPTPARAAGLEQPITTRAAADRLGCGQRAVLKAIHEDRLRATQDPEGRWWITEPDLARYERGRRQR